MVRKMEWLRLPRGASGGMTRACDVTLTRACDVTLTCTFPGGSHFAVHVPFKLTSWLPATYVLRPVEGHEALWEGAMSYCG